MKPKRLILFFLLLFLNAVNAEALILAGKIIPDTIVYDGQQLVLNGTMLRRLYGVKVYIACLYLEEKSSDPAEITMANRKMAIRLYWLRVIGKKKIKIGYYKSFGESMNIPQKGVYNKQTDFGTIDAEIDEFITIVSAKKIPKDTIWDYIYIPEKGSEIYFGDTLQGTVKTLEFKQRLFGQWLGDFAVISKRNKKKLFGLK